LCSNCVAEFVVQPKQKKTKSAEAREKGNRASRKSRLKKKEKFEWMEQRLAELEEENRLLKRKLASFHVY